jgi:hypothetical protein
MAALGKTMADLFPDRPESAVLAAYDFTDASGKVLFQKVRYVPKGFSLRQPDGIEGWVNNIQGVAEVPYHLPELLAVARGERVYVVEGEKDADRLARAGLVATTNAKGAGHWPPGWGEMYFTGLNVVVIPDNDEPGLAHAKDVQNSVQPHAASVRLVELPGVKPGGGDVSDWLDDGHTIDDLLNLVDCTEKGTEPIPADDQPLEFIDWTVAYDPVDDLVERYVIPGRWTQNIGSAKDGKSSLTMWIAIKLSEGRDPFDGTAVEPVSVIYCDGEMGRLDLEALIRSMGHDPTTLPNLHCTERRPRLDTAAGAKRLLWGVDRHAARLVVLDGLNGFVNPEASENLSETWRMIFECTVLPLKERGAAILSNDNMGSDPSKGSRGSTAKNDKADGVVVVKRIDQGVRLTTPFPGRAGAYLDRLELRAEGFDGSKPIRYWRDAFVGWPSGTEVAVQILDRLQISLDWGGNRVRQAVRAAGETVSNEALAAAIRYRKLNPIRPRS